MTIRHARARRGPVRALIVVLLLAGVFAMHGLTGSHDAAMALTHQAPPTQAVMHQMPSQSAPPHAVIPDLAPANESAAATPSGRSAAQAETAAGTTVEPGSRGHLHAMGDACLAMLTALALALVAALGVRGLLATYPVVVPGLAVRSIDPGPPPPLLQPTLWKLCVLRT